MQSSVQSRSELLPRHQPLEARMAPERGEDRVVEALAVSGLGGATLCYPWANPLRATPIPAACASAGTPLNRVQRVLDGLGTCLERVLEDLPQGSMDDVHRLAGVQIGLLLH